MSTTWSCSTGTSRVQTSKEVPRQESFRCGLREAGLGGGRPGDVADEAARFSATETNAPESAPANEAPESAPDDDTRANDDVVADA